MRDFGGRAMFGNPPMLLSTVLYPSRVLLFHLFEVETFLQGQFVDLSFLMLGRDHINETCFNDPCNLFHELEGEGSIVEEFFLLLQETS